MDTAEKLRNQIEKEIKSQLRKSFEVQIKIHSDYYKTSKSDIQLGIVEGLKSALKIIK